MQLSLKRLFKIYGSVDVGGNPGQSRGDCRIGKRRELVTKRGFGGRSLEYVADYV